MFPGTRFSAREGRWYGRRLDRLPMPDAYSPDSPGYAERNRQQVLTLPGGLTIVSTGSAASA